MLQDEEIEFDAEIRAVHVDACCQKECSKKFTLDELLSFNLDSKNMDFMQEGTNQLDIFILGQIKCICRSQDEMKTGRGTIQKERQRQRLMYTLAGHNVCERLFLLSNAIKIKRFKRLLKHFKTFGLQPPIHKNFKITPKKTLTRHIRQSGLVYKKSCRTKCTFHAWPFG